MKDNSFEKVIQMQFDSLVKITAKHSKKKYLRELSRRMKHELTFSDLAPISLNKLSTEDEHEMDYSKFEIQDIEVLISDLDLSRAIEKLSERSRRIILLHYYLGLSDNQIGEMMNHNRSTIYRDRMQTLKK